MMSSEFYSINASDFRSIVTVLLCGNNNYPLTHKLEGNIFLGGIIFPIIQRYLNHFFNHSYILFNVEKIKFTYKG